MRPVAWMVAASVASWLAVAMLSRGAITADVGFGMLGPLIPAVCTWLLIEHTFHSDPARVAPAMLQAFFVKLLYFGVYVVVMIRVVSLRPLPFVLSFTAYFLALHVTEAILLHRLTSRHRAPVA